MSQVRLAYPLLDGYILGDVISEHDGIRCYPAIRQKTGEKYIVKVIPFPSSRTQLAALVLGGAYKSKDDALTYYKELARDVVKQSEILRQLSQQEGFLPYLGAQILTAADENGYEVYLLGTYKQSLQQILDTQVMTHRGILELGLDLCAALAACRRAGYLYVDLQPGNIFHTENQGYRIGDLGFIPLRSLKFAVLPEQYHSCYTAPEMADAFAEVNTTLDIYALGLILYQACNGGKMPDQDASAPLYADYELAEIIAKACHADPTQRWQDPTQMAQALIGYMQRNIVTDTPLAPIVLADGFSEEAEEFLPETTAEELAQEISDLPEHDIILMHAMAPASEPEANVNDLPEAAAIEQEPLPAEEPFWEPKEDWEPLLVNESKHSNKQTAEQAEIDCPIERKPFPWIWIIRVAVVLLLVLGIHQARAFYRDVYVQDVQSIVITHQDNTATVQIISDIDETLLTVLCIDSYGNIQRSPVTAGIATFTDLSPQTHYTIRLEISGIHKLTGHVVDGFTTAARTNILSFTANIGPEDGSATLNIATSGPTVESWTVTYWAEDVTASATTFRGTSVTLYHLVVGKEYTFALSAAGHTLDGCTQITYAASNIILAEDLQITACGKGSITAQWNCPEGFTPVNGWAVRCYNSTGYDQTMITYEPHYTFEGIDHSVPCSIQVTYVGMIQSVSTSIGANPITVESFDYAVSQENGLTVCWTYSGTLPESGWQVTCVIDGQIYRFVTNEQQFHAHLFPGSVYRIFLETESGIPVLGGSSEYTVSEVAPFVGYGVNGETLSAQLSNLTITLTAPAETIVESTDDMVHSLCLIRNTEGDLCHAFEDDFYWNTIWDGNICTMFLPELPTTPGNYVLSVYFNGGWVAEVEFTVE